jgi:DNA repair exonuclease SbcCD nuclease subunit
MKVAIITDTHFGARNDSQMFSNYFRKFYEEIFFPTLEERDIHTVIHMGDVVDRRKFINWKTVYQMREVFFDVCYSRNINLHIIIGNHDVFFRNTNIVNSMEGLRIENNNQFHVYTEPTEIELDGTKLFMQPWICDENREQSLKAIQNTEAQILFGHLEVRGFEMHIGSFSREGVDANMFQKFDMAMSGHFHHKSDNGNIYYLGNPYQITWSDYKDPRGFHIFDTNTRELEFILNPLEMFHKIYYDDDKMTLESIQDEDYSQYKDCYVKVVVVKKNNPFWFDTLIDKLYKEDVGDISIVENFDEDFLVGDENLIDEAEDTMTILSKYVNSLNIDNKKELDTLMQSLYTESLSMETV